MNNLYLSESLKQAAAAIADFGKAIADVAKSLYALGFWKVDDKAAYALFKQDRKQQLIDAGLSDHYASLVMSKVDTACVAIMFNRVPVELDSFTITQRLVDAFLALYKINQRAFATAIRRATAFRETCNRFTELTHYADLLALECDIEEEDEGIDEDGSVYRTY